MRDSMIIYRSFYEAIKQLEKEDQAEIWNAIYSYALDFKEVELKGMPKTIFTLIKPQLDANIAKYKNGTKAKKSKTQAKHKQNVSKTEGNVNDNVNVNENDNVLNTESHNQIFRKLWKNQQWLESLCMKWKCEIQDLQDHLNTFRTECIDKDELKVDEKDAKTHFINWVKKGNEVPVIVRKNASLQKDNWW